MKVALSEIFLEVHYFFETRILFPQFILFLSPLNILEPYLTSLGNCKEWVEIHNCIRAVGPSNNSYSTSAGKCLS